MIKNGCLCSLDSFFLVKTLHESAARSWDFEMNEFMQMLTLEKDPPPETSLVVCEAVKEFYLI